jgi:hypothetical protein
VTVESGGIAPYNYAWSNEATTEDVTGLVAGSYSVVVTDQNALHNYLRGHSFATG